MYRFGFPESRIFIVHKGELRSVGSANRTVHFDFLRLLELLHEIFPSVVGEYRRSTIYYIHDVHNQCIIDVMSDFVFLFSFFVFFF